MNENIVGSGTLVVDPYYRYKMPKMILSYRKNGTIITNLDELAKSLNRKSDELLKMFSWNLGTHSILKLKLLSGSYTGDQLRDQLLKYIDEYILCETCGNPETIYILSKKKLCLQCQACSSLTKLNPDSKLSKSLMKTFSIETPK